MKHKIYYLILAAFIMVAGCNKKLDVAPQNTLTPDQIQSADDIKAVLFGTYSTFQNANALGEKYNTFGELLVHNGDLDWAGTFETYSDVFNNSQIKTSPEIYQIWANSYHSINAANIVLSKLDVLTGSEKDEIEGEAKFLRAVAYYYLVNLYAIPYSAGNTAANPGVPLILEPVTGYVPDRDKLPRASVEAVYAQIVNDLTDAAAKMPTSSPNFRANKYAALALLSRVYLSQAKYTEAATAANTVIESGEFDLTNTFAGAFNNATNSSEDIFAIQQTSQSNVGTADFGMSTFYSGDPVGRGEIQVTDAHIAKYETGDARKAFFYDGSSISGQNGNMTTKWRDLYKAIPVIRLAEMYLTRAEANYRKGGAAIGPNTPLDDVNEIRNRSNLADLGSIANVDVIVKERYLELAFEGERFFTVKRLKITTSGQAYDGPKKILPIPQREIDLGNSLPQNTGY
jgi:starch-binding outer membrane protein, SusD/RagB family